MRDRDKALPGDGPGRVEPQLEAKVGPAALLLNQSTPGVIANAVASAAASLGHCHGVRRARVNARVAFDALFLAHCHLGVFHRKHPVNRAGTDAITAAGAVFVVHLSGHANLLQRVSAKTFRQNIGNNAGNGIMERSPAL
jgi:hypothetical protein